MQTGSDQHVHGARFLKLGPQKRRQRRTFSPQFAREHRGRRFAQTLAQPVVCPLVQSRQRDRRTPVRAREGEDLGSVEPSVDAPIVLDRAFARLAGISRAVEGRQPSSHDQLRSEGWCAGARTGENDRAVVDCERHRRRSVVGDFTVEQRRSVPGRAMLCRNSLAVLAEVRVGCGGDQGEQYDDAKSRRLAAKTEIEGQRRQTDDLHRAEIGGERRNG